MQDGAASSDGSKQGNAQSIVKEQTEALVTAYLEKEEAIAKGTKTTALDTQLFNRLTNLVKDMLTGYDKLSDENLELMPWLNPVLSSFIQTDSESIRLAVQKLVKRLQKA